jgi:hypothetical protein
MAISAGRAVTVLLTEEHLRKIIEYHLLKEDEISDPVKLSRVVRKSLDTPWGSQTCRGMTGMGKGAYVTSASTSDRRDQVLHPANRAAIFPGLLILAIALRA